MNYFRAILLGAFVWLLVITTFTTLEAIPGIKDSFRQQSIISGILMVLYALLAAIIYYKKGNRDHGLKVGLAISATALVLDTFITVPFVEIPNGRSYQSFFTSPVLWILVTINVGTLYVYWKRTVSNSAS